VWPCSRDLLYKFWDIVIYVERVKVQSLNFACILSEKDWILNNKCKTGQNESWPKSHATSRSHDLLNKQITEAPRSENP